MLAAPYRPAVTAAVPRSAYSSRVGAGVVAAWANTRIGLVGVGGASYTAEILARTAGGPRSLYIIDRDIVDASNLARSIFDTADIGRPKAEAAADHIAAANPHVDVAAHTIDIEDAGDAALAAVIEAADLWVVAVDRFEAQRRLADCCHGVGVAAVFAVQHAGGVGGTVQLVDPATTACFHRQNRHRYAAYKTGDTDAVDLPGEPGLLAHGLLCDIVTTNLVIGFAERDSDSAIGAAYRQLAPRDHAVFRASPAHTFGTRMWDAALADLPRSPRDYATELKEQLLWGIDTLWLTTDGPEVDCRHCHAAEQKWPRPTKSPTVTS